jgi:hypothetical protein
MAQSPLHTVSGKDGLGYSSLLPTLISNLPAYVYIKDAEDRYVVSNTERATREKSAQMRRATEGNIRLPRCLRQIVDGRS